MKLTKLQRHTAYLILLSEFEKVDVFDIGICHVAFDCLNVFSKHRIGGALIVKNNLEELRKKLDKTYKWWGIEKAFPDTKYGKQQRIKLLKQCIEETY